MTISINETWESRSLTTTGRRQTCELSFRASGSDDETAILAAVLASNDCPSTRNGLYRNRVGIEPEGPERWLVAIEYGATDRGSVEETVATGKVSFQFDTTGETQHITQSRDTIVGVGAGWKLTDGVANASGRKVWPYKGAIGVSSKEVAGVDVIVPSFKFQVTKTYDASDITESYLSKLWRYTGSVNEDRFSVQASNNLRVVFEKGECRYDGASGSGADETVEITYFFQGSPNRNDIQIGDLESFDKRGWDYLWVQYRDTSADAGEEHSVVQLPLTAWVERVYPFRVLQDLNPGV